MENENECRVCNEGFIWDDDVILVNDELYHKDCVIVYPTVFVAYLGDECLGETENEDGSLACDYIPELLDK